MSPMAGRVAADPAPSVPALRADHVVAPHILFHRHLAVRTGVRANVVSPAFVSLFLGLRTGLPFVPGRLASVANRLTAALALDLGRRLRSLDDAIASRVRTKLLVRASTYLIGVHKALEFLEAVGAHNRFNTALLH